MTDRKLRQWRGAKPVAAPAGVAITARLRTSAEDEFVLDQVATHLGRLRRGDLAATSQRTPVDARLSTEQRRQARRDELNARKKTLTAQSSARWANAIIAGNDDQHRLSRDAQYRHIVGLRAAIATIGKRLAAPATDTLTAAERKVRRKAKAAKGYASQHERFAKQQRLQHLRAVLARAEDGHRNHRVRVVEGGKRLARIRHHLDDAGITADQWRDRWDAARYRITANGSPDEPFGNLTITVTPAGEISVRLPKPLEHFANAPRGRYLLSATAVFAYRGQEWAHRISGGNSVSYTITRKPGRSGRYLSAAWAVPSVPYWAGRAGCAAGDDVYAARELVGVDLNDGHLALRRLVELIDARLTAFADRYAATYPAAMKILLTDREGLTAYLRFPAEHHHRIWHSNFIERTFGETRRRAKVIGRFPGETSCSSIVWAVLDRASRGWRGLTMTAAGLRQLQDPRCSLLEPPEQLRPQHTGDSTTSNSETVSATA